MKSRTLVFKSDDKDFEAGLKQAAGIIREGGTVAFPTETVYGLGADALNADAVHKIFKAKGRPADNPLIVHIANIDQCSELAEEIPANAFKLMEQFWPGPLTLILKAKDVVPDVTTGGLNTVGLRVPDNPVALELIQRSDKTLAAPSANTSGSPSPTTAEHVFNDLDGKIDAILDGGPTDIGLESTVVDMTGDIPTILRPGHITAEDIRKCVGDVRIGYADRTLEESEVARSPGMKYTHYSPKTKVILIEGNIKDVHKAMTEIVLDCHREGERVGLFVTEETAKVVNADEIYSLGKRNTPSQAARSIFMGLRHLDSTNIDLIIVDGTLNKEGIGAAVFNRLRKAADRIINA
ncbi:tRNA threonylcarbamoyladenosine biosynthesis protein [Methanococcoides methylutens]|uniref:Threonylcarbamoyl-AMP synthase n=2 Tax=Methanococcoides methylutens TaxID=2226 RepID=A0A099T631_METMT|nr:MULTISPECIES: L-threonylcarbamoyladenylate synthase [Methanococcoides]KGK99593.1 tRNA threonylcarbamoyladenosine biosynthesis protein [Methanococcoides methylutens]UGV41001.1 threonylcarbamoyl-AMP synthase [Methanococcoides orientis]